MASVWAPPRMALAVALLGAVAAVSASQWHMAAAELRAARAAEVASLPPALACAAAGPLLALASDVFSDGDYARCDPAAPASAAGSARRPALPPLGGARGRAVSYRPVGRFPDLVSSRTGASGRRPRRAPPTTMRGSDGRARTRCAPR